ncbi:hypothetical protein MS3_00010559 [Schistosoma haematobium]|uniref:Uncharacterized protein n=1 Tax=Schistosoma haematobium TaxID=6185 RepID=A0A922LIY1_SCHHA|nr:hypothetical protein MS3_00010559 [Schistosoma haematobium]KAH9586886.1 hypothetical protein MS3_00010559 [Schistosoma haematobium]
MRYKFSAELSLSFCLIVVFLYEFFNCQNICEKRELATYKSEIIKNNSYLYSHHYNYSMRVRLDQSHPVVKGIFNTFQSDRTVTPKFPFEYFERPVKYLRVLYDRRIIVEGETQLGQIRFTGIDHDIYEFKVLDTQELIAAKWSIIASEDDTLIRANITCLIHPSGKISIYFEDVPTKINESLQVAFIRGTIFCEKHRDMDKKGVEIHVPKELIKSRTLAEFETIGSMLNLI